MPYDDRTEAANERRQSEWARRERLMIDAAVRAMLEAAETRKYLWWLLSIGRAVGQNPFTGNSLTTAFQCGEQNVGQQIMAHLIEVAPDGFLTLLKEQEDERSQRNSSESDDRDEYRGPEADPAYVGRH